ncbi:MAG: RNA-directed DNA polymerase [Reyranella sp.]|uniref:reverse transcriptase family protein n=1 Tax=Reyranella sp. TaxID=1929291 RepID=UPI001AD529F3|nr:reverse transcriptase family protein [Reyranella sp.]MBN9086650.1 RNA-directed DNA polymerase [Reyranella sp.]
MAKPTDKTISERYAFSESPLVGLSTQRKLAQLLGSSKSRLHKLVAAVESDPSNCYKIEDRQVGEKLRTFSVPVGQMRKIHERMKILLGRISLPEYVMSPRRGKTIATNATAHRHAAELLKVDVKSYYPSTTDELVFRLFHHRFGIPGDIAGLLTKLLTVNGRVPIGSPASPILAFWASKPAFDKIASAVQSRGLKPTLWVDDLSISGRHVPREIADVVSYELGKLGYMGHKVKFQSRRRGFSITGVRIDSRGPGPTNAINLKIRDGLRRLERKSNTDEETSKLLAQLIGLNGHRLGTMAKDHPAAPRARKLQQHLHQRRRRHLMTMQETLSSSGQADSKGLSASAASRAFRSAS